MFFHRHYDGGNDHEKVEQLDIVDGQQRTLTLILASAGVNRRTPAKPAKHQAIKRQDVRDSLQKLKALLSSFLAGQRFSSDISAAPQSASKLYGGERAVSRSDFTEADIDFLLNRCEVVTFVLMMFQRRFSFLIPKMPEGAIRSHDLLKAFHAKASFQTKKTS